MGLIKWIKRELDSSNTCKRRQSEPPLPGNSSQLPRDESYVKALSKFNEWREKQKIGSSNRLSRKQSKKLIERERRGLSDTFFENRNKGNNKEAISKNATATENSLYEEIQLNQMETPQHDLSSSTVFKTVEVIPTRHSAPTSNITSALIHTNSPERHPGDIYENVTHFDSLGVLNTSKHVLSPPTRFFKENSNPFTDVITPNRDQISKHTFRQIPRDLDAIRAIFKPIEASVGQSTLNKNANRFPPYQTVVNKHGDEVEYALPLNEKQDDDMVIRNASNYQQSIKKNFDFLYEKKDLEDMSVSFNKSQFQRKNVRVTDLDKTNEPKGPNDYSLPLNQRQDDSQQDCVVNTSNFEQYIEKNFDFLNDKEDLGVSGIPSASLNNNQFQAKNASVTNLVKRKDILSKGHAFPLNDKPCPVRQNCVIGVPNTSNYEKYKKKNFDFLNENEDHAVSSMSSVSFNKIPVTDLDKSSTTKESDDQNNAEEHNIIEELESLQSWSRNIGENIENNTMKKKESIKMHFAEIIVCNTQEVVEKEPRIIFEALNGTLHAGTFHCVSVTQFKPYRKEKMCGDSILQTNYEVLRKIRHPDISLLMGITVDNKGALDSLILEPLDFSLNHFIHKEGTNIPIQVCLLYTLQITNAVTYLHKNGLIHSNISSHTIYMCNLTKSVKLTSFELVTSQDTDLGNELIKLFERNKHSISSIREIPNKLRPYATEYRKTFTIYNYQAPELLVLRIPFVSPKIQSDVYGICLTLWEMVSCCTPYYETTFDDMVKLAYSKTAQLPTVQAERQKHFEPVLQLGLHVEARKRLSDTNKLNELLKNIALSIGDKPHDDKLHSIKENDDIPDLLSPKVVGPMVYERNSTIKKRHNLLDNNHLDVRQLFAHSQIKKTNGMIPSHTSSPNSPQCGFQIGEVSIPETPIARSNKLRKTAWLSNQSISPIVHLEIKSKDEDTAINQIQIVENKIRNADLLEDTNGNKLYNVNIRIRPTPRKPKAMNKSSDHSFLGAETYSPIQGNNNISHISNHIKFFNSVSQPKTPQVLPQIAKTASPVENHVNYNKNTAKDNLKTEKKLDQHLDSGITQKSINEFFSRNQSTADFEKSQWRREKQKCDQSVKSPRRISVKDAVNKFESFSKSMLNETNSPKARRTPISYTSSLDDNKIPLSNLAASLEEADPQRITSKLNIVLQNKDNTNESIQTNQILKEKLKDNKNASKEQSPMLTLNFKKLDRRASDLSSYFIRRNPKNKLLASRHSIYGTDIYKRLRKAKTFTEVEGDDLKEVKTEESKMESNIFEDKRKDFKIKVGKLACFNCGYKMFVFDDVVSSNKGEDGNEPCTELLLAPMGRNSGLQATKSIEDFYIDDDFCEDIELCANMELGTGSQLSDPFDFDIFSAEIFNPIEEKSNILD